jgi:hypothetical protein
MVRVAASRRVYTILPLLVTLLLSGASATAQSPAPSSFRLTLDPAMTKGPGGAPVMIVEFSDYQ